MLRTLSRILDIRSSVAANRLIYYIHKLPIVGRWLPADIYAQVGLKRNLAIALVILIELFKFATKFAYLGLIIYLPIMLLGSELASFQQEKLFIHIFVLMSFWAASCSSAIILEPRRDKYIAVKLMRLAPDHYMKATLTFKYVLFFVQFLPATIYFFHLFGEPAGEAVLFVVLLTAVRIVAELMHALLYERTGTVLVTKQAWVWPLILIGVAGAYVPLLVGQVPNTADLLLNLPAGLAIIIMGVMAGAYLLRYPYYRSVVDAATKRDDPLMNLGKMISDAQIASVQNKDSDYAKLDLRSAQFAGKAGYGYLNAIFFARHKRFIVQPMYKRLAIIGALFAAAIGYAWWRPEAVGNLLEQPADWLPFTVLGMYFLSIGDQLCKALFYHCDVKLLRHAFYREPRAIMANFRIRLGRMLLLNLLPAAAVCAGFAVLAFSAGIQWGAMDYAAILVSIASLALLFTMHHLFMYYFFQPYSSELNIKSPFFLIANSLVSALCYLGLLIPGTAGQFMLAVVVVAAAYSAAAFLLVRRFGSRRFRVR